MSATLRRMAIGFVDAFAKAYGQARGFDTPTARDGRIELLHWRTLYALEHRFRLSLLNGISLALQGVDEEERRRIEGVIMEEVNRTLPDPTPAGAGVAPAGPSSEANGAPAASAGAPS